MRMNKEQLLQQLSAMLRHRPHDPGQAWIQIVETMLEIIELLPDSQPDTDQACPPPSPPSADED